MEFFTLLGTAGGCAFVLRLAIDAYYRHRLAEYDKQAPKPRQGPLINPNYRYPRSWDNADR